MTSAQLESWRNIEDDYDMLHLENIQVFNILSYILQDLTEHVFTIKCFVLSAICLPSI